MGPAPQRRADVPRQTPQVRPTAHRRPELQVGYRCLDELELMNLDPPSGRRDGLTAPRPLVRPLPVDFHGRVGWRPLLIGAAESPDHRRELSETDAGPWWRGDREPGGVVRVGGDAETDDALVGLCS